MASRSRTSAAAVCSASAFCSVTSTAMPMQMEPGVVGLARDLAAHAQPHPVAGRVTHAEGAVDRLGPAFGDLDRELVERDVVGMHERVELAEVEQLVAWLLSEDGEHRMRPEDPAAREVPVPQAAAAAVERGVDAPAHHLVDEVGFARPRRLPVEGEAEDEDDEARWWRTASPPVRCPSATTEMACGFASMTATWPSRRMQIAHRHDRPVPSEQRRLERAGGGAECRQGLIGAEHVEERMSDRVVRRLGDDDDAVRVGDEDGAAAAASALERLGDDLPGAAAKVLRLLPPRRRAGWRGNRRTARFRRQRRRPPRGDGRAPARRCRPPW